MNYKAFEIAALKLRKEKQLPGLHPELQAMVLRRGVVHTLTSCLFRHETEDGTVIVCRKPLELVGKIEGNNPDNWEALAVVRR